MSSVPASCVHICFVSCPCFVSLWVKYVPALFMWLCVNYHVYLVPVFWVWFGLVYSLLPGVSCLWVLPCPALSCLDVIKDYYLSLRPRLRVPVPPSCVHRDTFGLLFCYQHFFIFSHITQHSIQNITKQNNRHILNISRSNQKGGREGRTTKTQKSLLYTITYIQQKTLPSINGRRPGPTDSRQHLFYCE